MASSSVKGARLVAYVRRPDLVWNEQAVLRYLTREALLAAVEKGQLDAVVSESDEKLYVSKKSLSRFLKERSEHAHGDEELESARLFVVDCETDGVPKIESERAVTSDTERALNSKSPPILDSSTLLAIKDEQIQLLRETLASLLRSAELLGKAAESRAAAEKAPAVMSSDAPLLDALVSLKASVERHATEQTALLETLLARTHLTGASPFIRANHRRGASAGVNAGEAAFDGNQGGDAGLVYEPDQDGDYGERF